MDCTGVKLESMVYDVVLLQEIRVPSSRHYQNLVFYLADTTRRSHAPSSFLRVERPSRKAVDRSNRPTRQQLLVYEQQYRLEDEKFVTVNDNVIEKRKEGSGAQKQYEMSEREVAHSFCDLAYYLLVSQHSLCIRTA